MIKERINKSPRLYSALLGLLVAFIGVVKYGIDIWPGWPNMFAVAQNLSDPHVSPVLAGAQDYILSSPTSALLLGVIPGSNQFVFVSGSVLLALFALVLPFLTPRISCSKDNARLLFIFIAGGSVLPLLLTWIGSYDPITVIGIALALGFRNRILALMGWIVIGFNHSAIGVISIAAVAVIYISTPTDNPVEDRLKPVLIGFLGIVCGFFINALLMQYWGGATSRWELFRAYEFSYYVHNTIAAMPMFLFSALGVGWLVILRPKWLKLTATKSFVALGIILPFAMSLTALDQTRVTAVVLLAPTLAFIHASTAQIPHKVITKTWKNLALVAVIVPVPAYLAGSLDQYGWQSILHWTANFS